LEDTAVKGIFERSWSWMKAENYRKEKKNAKQKVKKERWETLQKNVKI